jgi:hypothetical protein
MRYGVLMRYCGATRKNSKQSTMSPSSTEPSMRSSPKDLYTRPAIKTVQRLRAESGGQIPETRRKHQELSEVHLIAVRDSAVVLSP